MAEAHAAAVASWLKNDGQHTTEIHETIAPAVTHEYVTPKTHTETREAIHRDVHQDHYHTTVQPVLDQQVLETKHVYMTAEPVYREFFHSATGTLTGTDAHLARERDMREYGDVLYTFGFHEHAKRGDISAATHTTTQDKTQGIPEPHALTTNKAVPAAQVASSAPQLVEPHIHHIIQPVHEIHQNQANVRSTTELPILSMDEIQSQGGSLSKHGRAGIIRSYSGAQGLQEEPLSRRERERDERGTVVLGGTETGRSFPLATGSAVAAPQLSAATAPSGIPRRSTDGAAYADGIQNSTSAYETPRSVPATAAPVKKHVTIPESAGGDAVSGGSPGRTSMGNGRTSVDGSGRKSRDLGHRRSVSGQSEGGKQRLRQRVWDFIKGTNYE